MRNRRGELCRASGPSRRSRGGPIRETKTWIRQPAPRLHATPHQLEAFRGGVSDMRMMDEAVVVSSRGRGVDRRTDGSAAVTPSLTSAANPRRARLGEEDLLLSRARYA
ncbi:hypothetical protein CGRA01v4_08427 [Colletotrichum graminicola]|nr:hypothetical protein CGRA01v4_08427 [Colletotrichum graminicola]